MDKKPTRKIHKNRGLKISIIVLGVIVFMCAGFLLYLHIGNSEILADNIYVNSVCIGKMNVDDAVDFLEKEFGDEYFNKTVVISYREREYNADLFGVLKIDAEKTVKNAFEKSGNLWYRIMNKKKVVIPFEFLIDDSKIKSEILEFAKNAEGELFEFDEEYTEAYVDSSKIDYILDTDKTLNLLFENAKNDKFDDIEAITVKNDEEGFADALYDRLNREAQNALVGENDDKSTYIVPEKIGVKVDKNKFTDMFLKNDGKFKIDVTPVEPEIKTEDLDIPFYQDVLGSYTSSYNTGLLNRTKNVSLASRLVNGTVIMPGKRFSYNSVVGPRTYARGFVDATVYTGEGTEEGVGGGICQVSSTIYCAQLRADLKTVSRTNHSYTIVYVPLGQDATVVYGSLDYVFENNTNYPIKIESYANGGYLTVKIMGTKTDKTSKVDVISVTESTIAKGEVKNETSDLPAGQTEIKQSGQNGAVVSTYKVYYKNGVEVNREFIGKSHYRPLNKITLVGIGEKPEETKNSGESVDVPDKDADKNEVSDDEKKTEETVPASTDDGKDDDGETDMDLPTSDTGL